MSSYHVIPTCFMCVRLYLKIVEHVVDISHSMCHLMIGQIKFLIIIMFHIPVHTTLYILAANGISLVVPNVPTHIPLLWIILPSPS